MPDPKVEIVGIRELRLGEVLTMSYPGQPVLGTKQVVPMFLETMDPKTGEKVELKLALSMEQLAELQARAAKASTGTEYIGRLQFFGPLRVGDSGLSTNIYKPLSKPYLRKKPVRPGNAKVCESIRLATGPTDELSDDGSREQCGDCGDH